MRVYKSALVATVLSSLFLGTLTNASEARSLPYNELHTDKNIVQTTKNVAQTESINGSLRIYNERVGIDATINKPFFNVAHFLHISSSGDSQNKDNSVNLYSIRMNGGPLSSDKREDLSIIVQPSEAGSDLTYKSANKETYWYGEATKKMKQQRFLDLLKRNTHSDMFPGNTYNGDLFTSPDFIETIWSSQENKGQDQVSHGEVTLTGIAKADSNKYISTSLSSSMRPLSELKRDLYRDIWPEVKIINKEGELSLDKERTSFIVGTSLDIPEGFKLFAMTPAELSLRKEELGKVKSGYWSFRSVGSDTDYADIQIAFWQGNKSAPDAKAGIDVAVIDPTEVISEQEQNKKTKEFYEFGRKKYNPQAAPYTDPITVWYLLDHAKGRLKYVPIDKERIRYYFDGYMLSDKLGFYVVQIYGVSDKAQKKLTLDTMDKLIKSLHVDTSDKDYDVVRF